ncbi:cobalamin biosynthesis protein CobG [Halomonas sp. EGI 63088]|uniref:Cobalamin biosynthesis protein CobG n=1 Tax=Halomonas flagellata TaxID=2920385 RepID=A0ABS9RNK6_9GAMM|nr:cobalamin biosynthesis protein CobG [Halomonas flagellata]MCH4561549.1 cobalamin biosynthesis protein CobG [Halomonas flagellata]
MMNKMDKPAEPRIKSWCPGAWRPMATGDGLLVRVRPHLGRLTREQMLALCDAAENFGSGLIELTSRANLQLRGVSEATWPALMTFLVEHGLVDPDPQVERRPQVLLAPDWQEGDATHEAARLLQARLAEMPELPDKIGLAIDAGDAPVLGEVSVDFRIERSASGTLQPRASGGLLVRADGHALGTPVDSVAAAVEHLVRLAHWFVESGGRESGRMRRHQAPLPVWAPASIRPAEAGPRPALGHHVRGRVVGLPFGRAPASALRAAIEPTAVTAVRVTPWRRLLVEGAGEGAACAGAASVAGLLNDENDPRLAMQACPGAPHCEQASVETLGLAERLAGRVEGSVHVSGCTKGCARRQPAGVCLTGRAGRFDLIVGGCADGTPVATGLSEADLLTYLEKIDASRL